MATVAPRTVAIGRARTQRGGLTTVVMHEHVVECQPMLNTMFTP